MQLVWKLAVGALVILSAACGDGRDRESGSQLDSTEETAELQSSAYTYGTPVFRVNAGGSAISGTPSWQADTAGGPSSYGNAAQTGNQVFSTTATIDLSHSSVPSGTPMALFQTERWDPESLPEMQWNFPVTPGQYEVRLYLAEIYSGAAFAGARKFDVTIEGSLALNDYDMFAEVGFNKAVVKKFIVTSDSTLTVILGHVVENPALKGIEIVPVTASAPPLGSSELSINFGAVAVNQTASRTVTLTNNGVAGDPSITIGSTTISGVNAAKFSDNFIDGSNVVLAPGQTKQITVSFSPTVAGGHSATLSISHNGSNAPTQIPLSGEGASSTAPQIIYRVNAGGGMVAGTPAWSGDTANTPSNYVNAANTGNQTYSVSNTINMTDPSLPAGTPATIFQSERWDPDTAPEMQWTFPVAAGTYEVRLYFAEIYWENMYPGARKFSVAIEGQTVLSNFDVYAAAGAGYKGIMRSFVVSSDANLNIILVHGVENPALKGIEIINPSAGTTPAPRIDSLSPSSGKSGDTISILGADFGAVQGTSTVTFGGVAASVTSWSATNISAVVPNSIGFGDVPVVVTVSAKPSNSATFFVNGLPPIVAENMKAGNTDWPILNPGDTAAYAEPEAIRAGEAVRLHVHTGTSGTASYRLYRMGYYNGAGARLIATGTFTAGPQAVPLASTSTGMIECNWPVSATIQTGADWPSGYYLAKVKGANGKEHFAPFTLIGTHKPKILVSIPSATYQAYNFWGGASLYINDNKSRFPNYDHATVVSFLRPYATDGGAGQFLRLDHNAVKWLEAAGFDVGYVSNTYVAAYPAVLEGSAMYLSIGHDEYWPHTLRQALDNARDRGMHLVFWSGNTGLWQTRIEAVGANPMGRQVGFKHYYKEDPLYFTEPEKATGQFRYPEINHPENALLGIMWECCGISPSAWRPFPTSDPIWDQTGYTSNSTVARVVNGEFDRRWNNGFEPPGLEVLAESPVVGPSSMLDYAHTTRYQAPSGAWVYAMGSIGWQEGVGKPGETAADFQIFNANILSLVDSPRGNIHPPYATERVVNEAPQWLNTTVSTIAGAGSAGFGNGGASVATFNEPRDVVLRPGGGLYVADARNGAVRMILGGTVSTIVEGLGFPNGIAVMPDGKVYVSDPWRHWIWEIDPVAKTKRVLAGGLHAYQDGTGSNVGFANLNPLIASPSENVLYALDLPFGVRKITRAGVVTTAYSTSLQAWGLVRTATGFYASHPDDLRIYGLGIANLAGSGAYGLKDGTAGSATFTGPTAMIGTSDGQIFVADQGTGTIRRISGGQVVSVAGNGLGFENGTGRYAKFRVPTGMAYDPVNRQLFIADAGNHVIRMIQLP